MLFIQLSLIFCISTIPLSKGQAKECPPAGDISPCTCEKILDPVHSVSPIVELESVYVNCTSAPIADVHRVMEKMQSLKIRAFALGKYQSEDPLPAEFFQGLTMHAISIIESKFSFAPNRYPFEGLENSLLSLYLKKSQIGFPLISLGNLKKLKQLAIQEVEVKTLDTYWSDNRLPKGLEELIMDHCQIESMDQYSLTALQKLKILVLPYNRLTNFGRNVLPNPLNDLHTLHLNNNYFKNLDKDFFEGMPSLRQVNFRGNYILLMYWFTWKPVWYRLRDVDMVDNPLDCARYDLRWICNVKMPKKVVGFCLKPDKLQGVQIGSKKYCSLIGL